MKNLVPFLFCIGLIQCADLSTVRFLLWTRSNLADDNFYNLLWKDDKSLADSPFDGSRKTHFAFHGWTNNGLAGFLMASKTDFLDIEDINFISVDWETLAGNQIYPISASNMYEVAKYTAEFIDFLVAESSLTTLNTYVWGHSLGGQASGMTGHYVQSGTIGRITALDPAGPLFYNATADRRVDATSGAYVDIIHTNGGTSLEQAIKKGLLKAVGHADYYPNGGATQAGCSFNETAIVDTSCSHRRAVHYFRESIKSQGYFKAFPCESWDSFTAGQCKSCGDNCDLMGYHSYSEKHGSYFLYTNSESPFAIESNTKNRAANTFSDIGKTASD